MQLSFIFLLHFLASFFLSHSLYSHTIYEEEKKNLLVFCVFLYPDIVHYTWNRIFFFFWGACFSLLNTISYVLISKSSANDLLWNMTFKIAITNGALTPGAKFSKHSPLGCPTKCFSRGHFPSAHDRRAVPGFVRSWLMQSQGIAQKQHTHKRGGRRLPDNWADNF